MKRNKYTVGWLLASIVAVFQLAACTKFLDKKSDSRLIVPSTLEDMQKLLDNADIMNLATPSYGEASSDDYFVTDDTYNFAFNKEEQHIYRWAREEYNYQNDWSLSYLPIYTANLCLESLNKIDSTTSKKDLWNNVKGAALFFRSYYFLQIAWIHAKAYDPASYNSDLGIVLRLETDFNVPSVRASVKETYDRIIADATAAADYLPDYSTHPMRPSKSAAYGLLARAYLSIHDYDNSRKYANLCLSLKSDIMDYNANVDLTQYAPFPRFNIEVIFHTEMNTAQIMHLPTIYGATDTILYDSFHDDDLRKIAFFDPFGDFHSFKGNYMGDLFPLFTGIATDEMYLVRAESHARLGNKQAAMDDLNTLMKKRWNDEVPFPEFTATDADDALNQILIERRKELQMRGLRWSDIKRLNVKGANVSLRRLINGSVIVLPANDTRYALPLPADVIKNSNIEQN